MEEHIIVSIESINFKRSAKETETEEEKKKRKKNGCQSGIFILHKLYSVRIDSNGGFMPLKSSRKIYAHNTVNYADFIGPSFILSNSFHHR